MVFEVTSLVTLKIPKVYISNCKLCAGFGWIWLGLSCVGLSWVAFRLDWFELRLNLIRLGWVGIGLGWVGLNHIHTVLIT